MSNNISLRITGNLSIPLSELRFQFSRSSGPGGQNVNRLATRVELIFDVIHTPSLSDAERAQILSGLKSYIDNEGLLHLVSQRNRSQWRNREDVVARFQGLIERALRPRKKRRPTHPSKTSEARRLAEKRQRSETKRQRRHVSDFE
jgi:ribosome-associated protein